MTDLLTLSKNGVLKIYPKDMHTNDPYVITRENQVFKFRKNEQEWVEIHIESIESDSKRKPECFSEMTEDTDENGCDDCPYSEDCMEATSDIYEESLESDSLRTEKE